MKKSILITILSSIVLFGNAQTVIFEDSFFNNDNKWFTENNADGKIEVNTKLDQYLMVHKSKLHAYTSRMPIQFDENRNWRIEALLYKKGGTTHSGYGIIWGGLDNKNFYSFLDNGDGGYLYGKVESNNWQNITKGWKNNDAVESGHKGFNKIRVDKIGQEYSFYVNDVLVSKVPYTVFFGNQVGFNVNRKQKIIIEWIKVQYLN